LSGSGAPQWENAPNGASRGKVDSERQSIMKARIASTFAVIIALSAMTIPQAIAQQPYAYPNKGQTPDQQNRDQGECTNWAIQQSGYNPNQGSAPPPSGGVARGAVGGAAIGAIGGAIGGDAGKGAAIGAGAGALFGGIRQHRQREQQASQQQQAGAAYARAYGACMEGRGYTVK
jgi:hypothetical protein